jgi:VIT1/CCC1 family predicted Fe2+/Mn2+ transporter
MTTSQEDVRRYLENWQGEVDSAAEYRAMAAHEPEQSLAKVYESLAAVEEKHATFWEKRLRDAGREPGARKPSWRARILIWCAKRWGAGAVLPTVAANEYNDRNTYAKQRETAATKMPNEERMHARVLQNILAKTKGLEGSTLAKLEGRHRAASGNALRAAVLGANDGLCSNLALVMGVTGAAVSSHTVMLTGIAGLLAGACSMALGEWVSVTSARELAERELRIERAELEANPEEEQEELQLIYEAKGLTPEEAKDVSTKLISDPKAALDALSREELGIDPADLGGSPIVAGITSMFLFSFGALIPLFPFFFLTGSDAIVASLAAGAIGLFVVGAAISIFTGRPAWLSGGRQLILGLVAAGATYGIGRAIGVAVGG